MFDGLEGYRRFRRSARTFGYHELKKRIEPFFPHVQFYFPFPDYKVPSCVLSEEFIRRVKAGELVGRFRSPDYAAPSRGLFDERQLLLEIDKNDMLSFFANSFLVVGRKSLNAEVKLKSLGVIYSRQRVRALETITRFVDDADGHVRVVKTAASGQKDVEAGSLRLRSSATEWIHGLSLQTQILGRSKERGVTVDALFAACRPWVEALQAFAHVKGDRLWVGGRLLDCNWSNCYIVKGQCVFIDHEWEWHEDLSLSVLLIRNAYAFLDELEDLNDVVPALRGRARRLIITRIARSLGIRISKRDFVEFSRLQARIAQIIFAQSYLRTRLSTWISLECHWVLLWFRYGTRALARLRHVISRVADRLPG